MTQESNTPLTARSVLASALLGEDPPELPVAHLVHLAGLFGINENRARVALSRMAGPGEVTTDGAGRYRLSGHLLDRQGRQGESRRGRTAPVGRELADGRGHRHRARGRGARRPAQAGWPWPGWPNSARACGSGPTTSPCGPTRRRTPA